MIHMKNVMNAGGITFLLIHFRSLKETYLMYGKDLFFFWERQQKGGRKSITYEEVVTNGLKVPSIFHAPVHYLPILEKLT